MPTISFDKREYNAGETATITYTGAERRGRVVISSPSRKTYNFTPNVGSGSFKWAIPTDAMSGKYAVNLYDGRGVRLAYDTATVSGGAPTPPVTPPPAGFYDTGKVTPSTIEVEPSAYDVMFKLTGYKDKIITGVVVSEGATKTVSATLESIVAPPVTPPVTKKTVTFKSVPAGASINIVSR